METKKLSESNLEEVSGGVMNKRLAAGVLASLSIITGTNRFTKDIANATSSVGASRNEKESQNANENCAIGAEIKSYLKNEEISHIEEKLSNEFKNNEKNIDLLEISSFRYDNDKPTELEKSIDLAVESGDLPVKKFTLDEINNCAVNVKEESSNDKKPQFILVKGQDALELYNLDKEYGENSSIVQVASQFNALESMISEPTAVKEWMYDYTQGPRASLQSVLACKHRESAHLKNKLPDAIKELLEKCKLKDGESILKKYRNLYRNGYLELFRIDSEDDLKTFKEFISKNIGNLNFLSQWVKCNNNVNKQLQVFSAAPSFQGNFIDWSKSDARIQLLSEICKIIVVNEYKSIAQVAAIRSKITNKPISLHLTLVGQGAFRNPPKVVYEALKEVKKELEATDVKVYLHGYSEIGTWKNAYKAAKIDTPYKIIDRTSVK